MTNFKFTYFNLTALGEHVRYLFAYGDIPYEDNRIEPENFPAMKPNLPFGQLPLIEIDGTIVTQSIAIGRYLARKVGLYGQDDLESYVCEVSPKSIPKKCCATKICMCLD